jgi:hypothetical protein
MADFNGFVVEIEGSKSHKVVRGRGGSSKERALRLGARWAIKSKAAHFFVTDAVTAHTEKFRTSDWVSPYHNPSSLIPSTWKPCSVRRLPSGQVQVKIKRAKR